MRRLHHSILILVAALGVALPHAGVAQTEDLPEQWYFWTDDGVQHYAFEMGTARQPGDTIVVLHGGWGAEHSYLVRPLTPLASHHRFVFYDQRGSLRSPAPDSTIRLARLVDDLEHLRESLGLEQLTLLAHSMGGSLAYAYLAAYPDRVRGLILVGATLPAPFTGGPPMALLEEVWPDADLDAMQARQQEFFEGYPVRAREVMERDGVIPEHLRDVPEEGGELWQAMSDKERTRHWRVTFTAVNSCNPSRWREMEGGMIYYSQNVPNQLMSPEGGYAERAAQFWPAVRRFEGPVHVVIGTCDYVDLGPTVWPRVVDHLPNARLHLVENSGHAIWMDDPEGFTDAVRSSLAEIHGEGRARSESPDTTPERE